MINNHRTYHLNYGQPKEFQSQNLHERQRFNTQNRSQYDFFDKPKYPSNYDEYMQSYNKHFQNTNQTKNIQSDYNIFNVQYPRSLLTPMYQLQRIHQLTGKQDQYKNSEIKYQKNEQIENARQSLQQFDTDKNQFQQFDNQQELQTQDIYQKRRNGQLLAQYNSPKSNLKKRMKSKLMQQNQKDSFYFNDKNSTKSTEEQKQNSDNSKQQQKAQQKPNIQDALLLKLLDPDFELKDFLFQKLNKRQEKKVEEDILNQMLNKENFMKQDSQNKVKETDVKQFLLVQNGYIREIQNQIKDIKYKMNRDQKKMIKSKVKIIEKQLRQKEKERQWRQLQKNIIHVIQKEAQSYKTLQLQRTTKLFHKFYRLIL